VNVFQNCVTLFHDFCIININNNEIVKNCNHAQFCNNDGFNNNFFSVFLFISIYLLKLNAREKNVHAGEKLEDFETHCRIKWC
jgi:hypothetical protein